MATASRPELRIGLPARSRDDRLAGDILGALDADPTRRVLVLTPTDLARERVVSALLARRPDGAWLPEIQPLDAFVARALGRHVDVLPIGDAARLALLTELVQARVAEGELPRLAGGRDLPGLIGAIDHFFQALGRQQIWDADHLRAVVRGYRSGRGRRIDEDIASLYAAFRRHVPPHAGELDGNGTPGGTRLATRVERQRAAIAHPEVLVEALARTSLVVALGFAELGPLEAALFARIASAAPAFVMAVDAVEPALAAPEPEDIPALTGTAELIGRLGARAVVEPVVTDPLARTALSLVGETHGTSIAGSGSEAPATSDRPVTARVAVDPADEVTAIAESLAHALAERRPSDLAVAFPDPDRYLPLVREIFPRFGVPFHASRGIPLLSVPPVALTLAVIDAVANGYRRSDMETLLKSPYVRVDGLDGLGPERIDTWARRARVRGGGGHLEAEWIEPLVRVRDRLRRRQDDAAGADPDADAASESAERDRVELDTIIGATSALFDALGDLERCRDRAVRLDELVAALDVTLDRLGIRARLRGDEHFVNAGVGARDPELSVVVRRDAAAEEAFFARLDEIGLVLDALPRRSASALTLAEWHARLRTLLGTETITPIEEERHGVPVVGLVELRHVPASVVFIGGLTESRLPRARRRDVFYPPLRDPERDFLHVPDTVAEDSAALFGELVRRDAIHLSWPARDRDTDQIPSVLLERLASVHPPGPPPARRPGAIAGEAAAFRAALAEPEGLAEHLVPLDQTTSPERRVDLLAGVLAATTRRAEMPSETTGYVGGGDFLATRGARYRPGGRHVYSATELERFAQCGFAYFAERVLRLGELDDVEDDMSPLTRGRLLHEILYRFHRARLETGVDPIMDAAHRDELMADMRRVAARVLTELPSGDLLADATRETIVAGLDPAAPPPLRAGVLATFIDAEIARVSEGWRPEALEWAFGFAGGPPALALDTPAGVVRVRGKLDRVDRHDDSSRLVIDYKGGSVPSGRDTERGVRFQLPLYALAYASATADPRARWEGAYYSLRPRDGFRPAGFAFGGKQFVSSVELPRRIQPIAERAGRIAEAAGAGAFPVTTLSVRRAPCRFCAYGAVCRVDIERGRIRAAAWRASSVPAYLPDTEPT